MTVNTTIVILAILSMTIIYSLYVSYLLFRCNDYSIQQKIIQGFIICCIPIIGAIFIHQFMSTSNKKHSSSKSFANKPRSSSHIAEAEGD